MSGDNTAHHAQGGAPADGGAHAHAQGAEEQGRTYEITATDHINKSMLESFRSHLENKTLRVPENDQLDAKDDEWED